MSEKFNFAPNKEKIEKAEAELEEVLDSLGGGGEKEYTDPGKAENPFVSLGSEKDDFPEGKKEKKEPRDWMECKNEAMQELGFDNDVVNSNSDKFIPEAEDLLDALTSLKQQQSVLEEGDKKLIQVQEKCKKTKQAYEEVIKENDSKKQENLEKKFREKALSFAHEKLDKLGIPENERSEYLRIGEQGGVISAEANLDATVAVYGSSSEKTKKAWDLLKFAQEKLKEKIAAQKKQEDQEGLENATKAFEDLANQAKKTEKQKTEKITREEEIDNEIKAAENVLKKLIKKNTENAERQILLTMERIKALKLEREKLRQEKEEKQGDENVIYGNYAGGNGGNYNQEEVGNDQDNKDNKTEPLFEEHSDNDEEFEAEWAKQAKENKEKFNQTKENVDSEGITDEEAFFASSEAIKNGYEKKADSKKEDDETEIKAENPENSLGKMQKEADEAFEEYLQAEKVLRKAKENRGKFNKITLGFWGKGKEKEIDGEKVNVYDEYKKAKAEAEKLEEGYIQKYNKLANEIARKKKAELEQKSVAEEEMSREMDKFFTLDKVVSARKKQEEGIDQEVEKMSLFDLYNKNQQEILKVRENNLSENKKGAFRKAWEWHSNLPKKKKFLMSCAISLGVGASMGALVGGGVAGAAAYLGYEKVGKVVVGKILTMAGVGGAVGGVKSILDYDKAKVERKSEKKRGGDLMERLNEESGSIAGVFKDYNKTILKKEKHNRRLLIAFGATVAFALGTEFRDAWADTIESSGSEAGRVKIPERKVDESSVPEKPVGEAAEGKVENLKKNERLQGAEKYFTDKTKVEEFNNRLDQKISGAQLSEAISNQETHAEELLGNSRFELKSGGTVYGSLSEHFGGNRQEVGRVLAEFKKETVEDLIKNHGMTNEQADQFIDWRYRHMSIGTDFELKNGKLEIPGFDDQKMINRFSATEFNGVTGDDRLNSSESSVDSSRRLREVHKKNFNAEAPAPVSVENTPEFQGGLEARINEKIGKVYPSQDYEWKTMSQRGAADIMKGDFGDPIHKYDPPNFKADTEAGDEFKSKVNRAPDWAEIKNRERLQNYLHELAKKTGQYPGMVNGRPETVFEYIKRNETAGLIKELKLQETLNGTDSTQQNIVIS